MSFFSNQIPSFMKPNQAHLSGLPRTTTIAPPATNSSHLNVAPGERIASLLAGSMLTYHALKNPGWGGLLSGLLGGILLWRGATGHSSIRWALDRDTAHQHTHAVEITDSVTINRPRPQVYWFWRHLENLPRFMHYLEDVQPLGPHRSRWVARLPKGLGHLAWEADMVQEVENELIVWRSQPGSDVDNAGEIRFLDAPDNPGTLVQATISYRPPAGNVGELAARFLNPTLRELVSQDLDRLKHLLETGEGPGIARQPSGRREKNVPTPD
jgi:uncharacterized membrane protein